MRFAFAFALSLCLFVSSASAEIENGSFDAGLDNWTVFTDGVVVVTPDALGNPSNSALILAQPEFGAPVGYGWIYQTFYCGAPDGPPGLCMIYFQYSAVIYGQGTISIDAYIDGNQFYHGTHTPLNNFSGWVDVAYGVPCGLHTISIKASAPLAYGGSSWGVWVDNVLSNCLPAPVGTESSTWGRIKSMYR